MAEKSRANLYTSHEARTLTRLQSLQYNARIVAMWTSARSLTPFCPACAARTQQTAECINR